MPVLHPMRERETVMHTCRHLHLAEREPVRPTDPPSFACLACRSIVGSADLPMTHHRTIEWRPIGVHPVNTWREADAAAELSALAAEGNDVGGWR